MSPNYYWTFFTILFLYLFIDLFEFKNKLGKSSTALLRKNQNLKITQELN